MILNANDWEWPAGYTHAIPTLFLYRCKKSRKKFSMRFLFVWKQQYGVPSPGGYIRRWWWWGEELGHPNMQRLALFHQCNYPKLFAAMAQCGFITFLTLRGSERESLITRLKILAAFRFQKTIRADSLWPGTLSMKLWPMWWGGGIMCLKINACHWCAPF